jgi:hypothetical protein
MWSVRKIPSIAVFLAAITPAVHAASAGRVALVQVPDSTNGSKQAKSDTALPEAFNSVLPKVKAKSRVPILLPSKLPESIGRAEHAVVQKAEANEYAISLYYKLGVGDSGFSASFSGSANPGYSPQELGNVSEVKLARGLRGFFRPISCGGSCAPANLWWEAGGIVYQIQLKLPSSLSEEDQQKKTMAEVANSAILAGPR